MVWIVNSHDVRKFAGGCTLQQCSFEFIKGNHAAFDFDVGIKFHITLVIDIGSFVRFFGPIVPPPERNLTARAAIATTTC
jgi:hypothetical protein